MVANPTTIADLVAAIEEAHAGLDATLLPLTSDQMNAPMLEEGWSVKDVLAHITFWEQRLLHGLRTDSDQPHPAVPPVVADISPDNWIEETNARIFSLNHDRDLHAIRDEYQRSYAETLDFIKNLTEHDVFDPGGLRRRTKRDVLEFIAGNTYEHYEEHCEAIERAFPPTA